MLNKKNRNSFSKKDEEDFDSYMTFIIISLRNSMAFEREGKALRKSENLLEIATTLCQELEVDKVISLQIF